MHAGVVVGFDSVVWATSWFGLTYFIVLINNWELINGPEYVGLKTKDKSY